MLIPEPDCLHSDHFPSASVILGRLLVSSGCQTKCHGLGFVAETTEIYFLTIWEAGKSNIKVPAGLMAGECSLLGWQVASCLLIVSLHSFLGYVHEKRDIPLILFL